MDNDRQARIGEFMRELDVAGTISSNNTNSIYRIPCPLCIRELNPALYEPQILSLGPYHHGKPQFQAMDKLKRCYFKSFLRRNQNLNVEDYFNLVENKEKEARCAYSEQEPPVNFVEMMLLDCCFVLVFLLINTKSWRQGEREREREIINPILNSACALPLVLRDMLLLENQLPFFLLKSLLEMNIPNRTSSFTQIVPEMFSELMPGKICTPPTDTEGSTVIHHILHLMYSRIIPVVQEDHQETVDGVASQEQAVQMSVLDVQTPMPEDHPNSYQSSCPSGDSIDDDASQEPTVRWIPCAKRLSEAGVRFKKKTNYRSFLDVTFDRGTMEIPPLQVFGSISSIFNNLIAFEHATHPKAVAHPSTYPTMLP